MCDIEVLSRPLHAVLGCLRRNGKTLNGLAYTCLKLLVWEHVSYSKMFIFSIMEKHTIDLCHRRNHYILIRVAIVKAISHTDNILYGYISDKIKDISL